MEETEQITSEAPCPVCGTDVLYLSSGYYFCTECGTQREGYQKQVFEFNEEIDFTKLGKQKIHKEKADKNVPKMTNSRMNLHCLNFILVGLVDEVIAAGAMPQLKPVVLQLWIKLLQKENIAFKVGSDENQWFSKQQTETINCDQTAEVENINNHTGENLPKGQNVNPNVGKPTEIPLEQDDLDEMDSIDYLGGKQCITMFTFYAIIYLALNIIEDDMQLGDLLRLMRENRLSYKSYLHFLPADINFTYLSFTHNSSNYPTHRFLRTYTEELALKLKLKKPKPPNMKKLISRFMLELQLPAQLLNCVYALFDDLPPFYNTYFIPDFEGKAMSYIVVTLKILFGLDDYTEIILSDLAEELNVSAQPEAESLFVWRDWTKFIEYRKICLGIYHFPTLYRNDPNNMMEDSFINHFLNTLKMSEREQQKNDLGCQLIDDMLSSLLSKHLDANSLSDSPVYTFPPSLMPNYTNMTILLNNQLNETCRRDILCKDFKNNTIEYLLNRNQLRLLEDYRDTIKIIYKRYKRPNLQRVAFSDYKFLEISHLLNTIKLNDNTIYAINCPNNMQWTKDEVQDFLYNKHITPETKVFIAHKIPFGKAKFKNIDETVIIKHSSEINTKIRKKRTKKEMEMDAQNSRLLTGKDLILKETAFKESRSRVLFLYWAKHYCDDLKYNTVFEKELNNSFPQSFAWLLRECANILESKPMYLYKEVANLERMLMGFIKQYKCIKR